MKGIFRRYAVLAILFAVPQLIASTVNGQALNVQMPVGSSCPPAYHWEMVSGYARCIADPPPTPPAQPDPPPPDPPAGRTCRYERNRYSLSIGPMGSCSADGGCSHYGWSSLWDGQRGGTMWLNDELPMGDDRAVAAIITADIAAKGFSLGAHKQTDAGNGNYGGISTYEVCR